MVLTLLCSAAAIMCRVTCTEAFKGCFWFAPGISWLKPGSQEDVTNPLPLEGASVAIKKLGFHTLFLGLLVLKCVLRLYPVGIATPPARNDSLVAFSSSLQLSDQNRKSGEKCQKIQLKLTKNS